MSKVVRKGAGRPAAAAKKARHDQRTPLPPRKSAKSPVARKAARNEAEERADEVRGVGSKAAMFLAYAREHEWWAELKTDKESGRTVVTCKRDDGRYKEMITVEWIGDRLPQGGVIYTNVDSGRTILLRNVSAARKHIDGSNPVKRDAQPRKVREQRVDEDGNVIDRKDNYKPIGADIIDKWYDIVVTKKVRVKSASSPKVKRTKDKVHARVQNVGKQQVDSLRRFFEADGFTVEVTERGANK